MIKRRENHLILDESDRLRLLRRGYEVRELLGSGGFGEVYKATYYRQYCAAKLIQLKSKQTMKEVTTELFMLQNLHHPHIINMWDVFYVKDHRLLVFMELAQGGDLDYLIDDNYGILEQWSAWYYRQFASALQYMHSIGYAHRDIKAANVLLDASLLHTKLTDFGLSAVSYEQVTGYDRMSITWCGTRVYQAPEFHTGKWYDAPKADVYSTGVLLFFMLNAEYPFDATDLTKMEDCQVSKYYKYNRDKRISSLCKEFIDLHFAPIPSERPSFDKLLKHRWCQISSYPPKHLKPTQLTKIKFSTSESSNESSTSSENSSESSDSSSTDSTDTSTSSNSSESDSSSDSSSNSRPNRPYRTISY